MEVLSRSPRPTPTMTDEELAKMLWKTGRNYRAVCADPVVDFKERSAELIDWLKQPYEEATDDEH